MHLNLSYPVSRCYVVFLLSLAVLPSTFALLCSFELITVDVYKRQNPCQLKIINHGLYITNDGWKTAKAGVGQFYYFDPKDKVYKEGYGIIADTLVGNLILSSQVGIYNEEKSIEMDKNGIIVTTNTYVP